MTETVSGPAARKGRRGKGLKIRRINTTAGVHPYEQVAWERRDVVMTNWRDGSVNFERRGGHAAARVVAQAARRPGDRRLHEDRPGERLLRDRRGRGDLRPRAQVRADPPDLQL